MVSRCFSACPGRVAAKSKRHRLLPSPVAAIALAERDFLFDSRSRKKFAADGREARMFMRGGESELTQRELERARWADAVLHHHDCSHRAQFHLPSDTQSEHNEWIDISSLCLYNHFIISFNPSWILSRQLQQQRQDTTSSRKNMNKE